MAGEDQVERGLQTDEAGQAQRAAQARQDSEARLGKPQTRAGMVARHSAVAGEGQLQTATHTGPADSRQRRYPQPIQPQQDLLTASREFCRFCGALERGEFLDVGAGDEVAPLTALHQEGANLTPLGALLDGREQFVQPQHHGAGQQVDLGVGAIEGERSEAVPNF